MMKGLQLRNLIRLRLQDVADQLPGTVGFVIPDPTDPTNPDPGTMSVPDPRPPTVAKLPCGATEILALYRAHLALNLVAAPAEACA